MRRDGLDVELLILLDLIEKLPPGFPAGKLTQWANSIATLVRVGTTTPDLHWQSYVELALYSYTIGTEVRPADDDF